MLAFVVPLPHTASLIPSHLWPFRAFFEGWCLKPAQSLACLQPAQSLVLTIVKALQQSRSIFMLSSQKR